MSHRGQIVEKIVRKSGYSLTKLGESLDVSRNTLYNKFKKADLDYWFIIQVGNVIHYDFTLDFPEMKEQPGLTEINVISVGENKSAELWRLENKYIRLLETYSRLLELVVKVANQNELHLLSQEIQKLIEEGVTIHE